MPGNQLSHAPLQAMSRGILGIATGLRGAGGFTGPLDDALALTPEGACRNALLMLRTYSPLLQSAINTFGPFAILGYGLYRYVWNGYQLGGTIDWIRSHFVSTVTVPGVTPLNQQIISWMASQNIGTNGRSLTVHNLPGETKKPNDWTIGYIPAVGSAWFKFEGHAFKIERSTPKTVQVCSVSGRPIEGRHEQQNSDIVITLFGGGVEPIKRFLDHICDSDSKPASETAIFRTLKDDRGGWGWPVYQPSRNLDSVSMSEEVKQSLVKDINNFFTSVKWYNSRGIPHRRGLLFYGPPGTGKTSFSTTIAGHWDLPLYILSLSNKEMNDDNLESLFKNLPDECIVLLEDVDAAGIQRENMAADKAPSKKGKPVKGGGGITLSGLLNVIDGPVAKEGRLLILTSNSPDSLDKALIRPGRVDRKILFGNASREVMEQLFSRIYGDAPGETAHSPERNAELIIMGKEFASKMPEDKLTPAEVQNFLLIRRDSPEQALLDVEAWQADLVLTKAQGRNVAEFSGQILSGENNIAVAVTGTLAPPTSPEPTLKAKAKSRAKG